MTLSDLTHLWIEQPLRPEARALVPAHVEVLHGVPPAPAQAVVAVTGMRYGDEFMEAAPKLRIVSRAGIGIDNVDVAAATRRGIVVCSAPDGPTESTAEHAVALMLALAKRLKPGNQGMAQGKFGPRETLLGTELRGKTLGVLGLGRVGRRVAEICGRGLGMEVVAFDPVVTREQAAAAGVTLASLDEVFARADVLSLHVPLLPETRHLVDRGRLARMKPGAYLVNVSRGAIVVETDLLEALDRGHLAGAGLDVFDPEPPAPESPLRRHPNVVATPHIASATVEGRGRTDRMAVERILEFFRGDRPGNVVNPEVLG